MKVTILGTGCIWTKRSCASYLIDDDIIVDPGSGTLKQLLKTSNTLLHHEKIEKIRLILVTHYHADHYFDIVYLLWKLANEKNPETHATIICPPGGEEKIKQLCVLAMSEPTYNKLNFDKYIKFVDASKMGTYYYKDLEITSLKMDHGPTLCYGYVVKQKGGKAIGFTGDTNDCENLRKMLDTCQLAFVDMAGTDISNKHYNIIDGIELMKKYEGKCNIVPGHLTSQALDYCRGKISPPEDLMVLDADADVPYNFELEEENYAVDKDFSFQTKKFENVCGEIVDLFLYNTKRAVGKNNNPEYEFNILLHGTQNKIGTLTYQFLPGKTQAHEGNIDIKLLKDYDLKSVKYECCQLIKKVAGHHGAKSLYLTCEPTDFKTRKVFEHLGAVLQEIKTIPSKENGKRVNMESCIWLWEFIK